MDTEPPMLAALSVAGVGGSAAGAVEGQANSSNTILQNERQVVRRAGRQAIRQFLEQHNCFSVLRASGKVVVFDTRIPVQLAFYALVEHDMLAAPLWEPVQCQFVGLFTVTDFIDILRDYQATGKDVSDLATHSIAEIVFNNNNNTESGGNTTTNITNNTNSSLSVLRPFRGADSSCSLQQACQQLLQTGDDFLPIVFAEDMRVLACLSYTNMLEHLVTHFREQRRLFDDSIADLGIGTWGNNNGGSKLITVHQNQTLAQALELMQLHSLSALPVLDDNERIFGVYSRSDITFLTTATDAQDAVRNLDLQLIEVLTQQRQQAAGGGGAAAVAAGAGTAAAGQQQASLGHQHHHSLQQPASAQDITTTPDALRTCSPSHTLQAIFESFSQLRFNRLYVVDADDRLLGVVSAKDLVAYFLMDDDDAAK